MMNRGWPAICEECKIGGCKHVKQGLELLKKIEEEEERNEK